MAPASGDGAAAGGGADGGAKGYSAPIVKVESDADALAAAGLGFAAEGAKAEGDDVADYDGGDEKGDEQKDTKANTKSEPQREMPDYGDLVDGDAAGAGVEVKDDVKAQPEGDRRPQAIYISGVQRLTRTHLAEVFDSKSLPQFVRLEWIGDEEVVCIFKSAEDAAFALKSAQSGFGDTAVEDVRPGPGLWRAQRGMLDFRYATTGDRPGLGWKKQHRAGKQVREFRFWEAIKDMDRGILDKEDEALGIKRIPLFTELPPEKRRRVDPDAGGAIDLLEQMAAQDKGLLAKEDKKDNDDEAPWPVEWEKAAEANAEIVDEGEKAWDENSDAWWKGSWQDWGGRGGGWQRDGRNNWNSDGKARGDSYWSAEPRKRRRGGAAEGRGGGGVLPEWGDVDDTERAKRSKRSERFQTPAKSGPAATPAT